MTALLHLHVITLIIIGINFLIFNQRIATTLGSKYFLINYVYHNHKYISCFLITYPFVILLIYYMFANVMPIGSLFISILHVYFLYELTSGKNIVKQEEYIYWYKHNVKHSFSMHAHDMIKNDFKFLTQKLSRAILFKFEIIFFIAVVIESEVMIEVMVVLDGLK